MEGKKIADFFFHCVAADDVYDAALGFPKTTSTIFVSTMTASCVDPMDLATGIVYATYVGWLRQGTTPALNRSALAFTVSFDKTP